MPWERVFRWSKWTAGIFIATTIFCTTLSFADPDQGWHVRLADEMALSGTLFTGDQFSYTMEGYRWTDHEWLYHLLLGEARKMGISMKALAVVVAILCAGIFLYWAARARTIMELFIVSISAHLIGGSFGLRAQTFSFLLFLLTISLVRIVRTRPHVWWSPFVLPLFFVFWANFHGGFVAGLIYLWAIVLGELWQMWKKNKRISMSPFFATTTLSTFATLINPYGFGLWTEVIHATSWSAMRYIGEWLPAFAYFTVTLAIIIIVHIITLRPGSEERSSSEVFPAWAFLPLYLLHVRMGPFYVGALLSPLQHTLERAEISLHTSLVRWRHGVFGYRSLMCAGLFISLALLPSQIIVTGNEIPSGGVRALQSPALANIQGNIFNAYGFGGTIIGETDRKVFIDGRMPHWDRRDGSPRAMEEYVGVARKEAYDWQGLFHHYDIKIAMIPSSWSSAPMPDPSRTFTHPLLKKIADDAQNNVAGMLERAGWCLVYEDNTSTILIAPGERLCKK